MSAELFLVHVMMGGGLPLATHSSSVVSPIIAVTSELTAAMDGCTCTVTVTVEVAMPTSFVAVHLKVPPSSAEVSVIVRLPLVAMATDDEADSWIPSGSNQFTVGAGTPVVRQAMTPDWPATTVSDGGVAAVGSSRGPNVNIIVKKAQ